MERFYSTGARTSCWVTCKQGKLVKKRVKTNEDERDHSNLEGKTIPLSISLNHPEWPSYILFPDLV